MNKGVTNQASLVTHVLMLFPDSISHNPTPGTDLITMDYLIFTHTLHPCEVLFCLADMSARFFCCLHVFQPSRPSLTVCLYNEYAAVLPITPSSPVIDLCLPLRLFISLQLIKLHIEPHSVDPSLQGEEQQISCAVGRKLKLSLKDPVRSTANIFVRL